MSKEGIREKLFRQSTICAKKKEIKPQNTPKAEMDGKSSNSKTTQPKAKILLAPKV